MKIITGAFKVVGAYCSCLQNRYITMDDYPSSFRYHIP